MKRINYERLKYRRQYIITNLKISCPFKHFSIGLNEGFVLFPHVDLIVSESSYQKKRLILLGDIYDWRHPEYDNQDIINDIIQLSLYDLLERITTLSGRFVIIFEDKNDIKVFHDASAARKIFYTKKDGYISCSSNQHLLARIMGISPTNDSSKREYYSSNDFKLNYYSNIVDNTFYDEILQLLPNHFLNINTFEIKRYWPRYKMDNKTKGEIISECASMIKGFLFAAAKRYKLMIPLTAGYDSRILLAASKEIKEEMFFYLNDSEYVQNSPDGQVPQKMLSDHNLQLNLLKINKVNDKNYRDIYYHNNLFANPEYEYIIYNYLINFSEWLNLPGGTIPIIKSSYYSSANIITGKTLANLHGYDKYQFAINAYNKWLYNLKDVCEETNTNIFDLLHWEDKNCNGSFQIQQDKDIAQEDFVIFNSAYLISLMLSYDIKLRRKPYLQLHKEIIRHLWPDLLAYPFNPSTKKKIIDSLIKLRIYSPVHKLKKVLFG